MSMDQGRHALGVDFGTSNTVAVARWPDGRSRPILLDGSPLLPSAVYAETSGLLVVGRDAVHSARRDPARFEPNPKRRIDDGTVLLGDREVEVVDLITAVLVRVVEEWHRAVGPVRPEVTLTCPATWGSTRRGLLAEAAARAGLERVRLVAEPVAAATYFAEVLGRDVPIGSVVVVHDFGAGTFDASVVARTAEGFEVLAVDGRDDLGGLDIDAALVEHLGTICASADAGKWQRLSEPETVEDRRAQRQLWDDARIAKERLSRSQSADIMIPLLDTEIHVTRDELEALARPILEQTVQVTSDILRWADLPAGRLAGVFLVGGASRIPMVATLLHRELGEPPVAIEQPELVVAEGSLLAAAALLASEPAAPGPTSEMLLPSSMRSGSLAPSPVSPVAPSSVPPAGPSPVSPAAPSSAPSSGPFSTPGAASSSGSGFSPASSDPAGFPPASPSGAISPASGAGLFRGAAAGDSGAGPASSDNMETVPQSRSGLLGRGPAGDGMPPAVDPWPDAQHHWIPDPDATVASQLSPASLGLPPADPRSSSYPGLAGGSAATTQPVPPGVGHPARGDRSATGSGAGSPRRTGRTSAVRSAARNQSFAAGGSASGGRSPAAGRSASGSVTGRPASAVQPRRSGSGLRGFQIVLSVIVMLAAPVLALLVAYSYTSGVDLPAALSSLLSDLGDLL